MRSNNLYGDFYPVTAVTTCEYDSRRCEIEREMILRLHGQQRWAEAERSPPAVCRCHVWMGVTVAAVWWETVSGRLLHTQCKTNPELWQHAEVWRHMHHSRNPVWVRHKPWQDGDISGLYSTSVSDRRFRGLPPNSIFFTHRLHSTN